MKMPNFMMALLNATRVKYPSPQRQRFNGFTCGASGLPCEGVFPTEAWRGRAATEEVSPVFTQRRRTRRVPSFPHAFSGNPGETGTGPPIKTFGVTPLVAALCSNTGHLLQGNLFPLRVLRGEISEKRKP